MAEACCECGAEFVRWSALVCADCRRLFHYPDSRVREPGEGLGVHLVGLRQTFGVDTIPLCRWCDMMLRLKYGTLL